MSANKKTASKAGPKLVFIALLFALCYVIGVVFYHFVEGYSYTDAIYFTAMTLTTVGYGDFTPQTDVGKLFTAVYAFVGVATFLGFAATLFEAALHRHHRMHKH